VHSPVLSKLALHLLGIPASSAAIEQLFSQWSYVHNPLDVSIISESKNWEIEILNRQLKYYEPLYLRMENVLYLDN
jgi:hypothetical protein